MRKKKEKQFTKNTIAFGLEKLISDDIKRKFPKKIFSFSSVDKVSYVLRAKQKIPHAKEIALALFDAAESGYGNAIIEMDNKDIILLKKIDDTEERGEGDIYICEILTQQSIGGNTAEFAENYFKGFGFVVFDQQALKDIEAVHIPNRANKIRLIVFLLIVAVSFFMYVEYTSKNDTQKIKPPMPSLPSTTIIEMSDLKRNISLHVFEVILRAISKISNGKIPDTVNTTRISMINFQEYRNIPQEIPYYDETSNTWLYSSQDKKRGGLKLKYSFKMEKSYPENGYTLQGKVNEKNIYTREEQSEMSMFFNPDSSKDHFVSVPFSCLREATDLGMIRKRKSGLLEILIQNDQTKSNYEMVYALKQLMDACPIYADRLTISGKGAVSGNIYFYYKFPSKPSQ